MIFPLFLGVDGGGTGCRARVHDSSGRCIGSGFSGPATLRLGAETALASVMTATRQAIVEAGLSDDDVAQMVAGLALAGSDRKGARKALLALPHPFASMHVINDAQGAFLGAHSGRDGAIVIAGTGSVGLGNVGGRALRVGGYGFPVSDEGSGAYMGLRAVQFALRAHDGRCETTGLLHHLMRKFDNQAYGVVAWMDGASASDYAKLAPMVIDFAGQGDSAAQTIVRRAATHIERMITCLMDQGASRVSLLGGLSGALGEWLRPEVFDALKPVDGDAVDGALVHAHRSVEDT